MTHAWDKFRDAIEKRRDKTKNPMAVQLGESDGHICKDCRFLEFTSNWRDEPRHYCRLAKYLSISKKLFFPAWGACKKWEEKSESVSEEDQTQIPRQADDG